MDPLDHNSRLHCPHLERMAPPLQPRKRERNRDDAVRDEAVGPAPLRGQIARRRRRDKPRLLRCAAVDGHGELQRPAGAVGVERG